MEADEDPAAGLRVSLDDHCLAVPRFEQLLERHPAIDHKLRWTISIDSTASSTKPSAGHADPALQNLLQGADCRVARLEETGHMRRPRIVVNALVRERGRTRRSAASTPMPIDRPTRICSPFRCRGLGHRPLPRMSRSTSGSLKHRLARSLFLYGVCNAGSGADDGRRGLHRLDGCVRGVLRTVPRPSVRRCHADLHQPREDCANRGGGGSCHLVEDATTV